MPFPSFSQETLSYSLLCFLLFGKFCIAEWFTAYILSVFSTQKHAQTHRNRESSSKYLECPLPLGIIWLVFLLLVIKPTVFSKYEEQV